MKELKATLGPYAAIMRIEDGVDEEKAQDMVNRRVAQMYVGEELDTLKKTIKQFIELYAKEKEV